MSDELDLDKLEAVAQAVLTSWTPQSALALIEELKALRARVGAQDEQLCQIAETLWFTLYWDHKNNGALGSIEASHVSHAWVALPVRIRSLLPDLPKAWDKPEDLLHVSTAPKINRQALKGDPS